MVRGNSPRARVRRAVGARKLGARKCEILGLPARALGVIAAEKVAQAVRPDLPRLAALVVDHHERLGAQSAQPAMLTPRASERTAVQALAELGDRAQCGLPVAMLDDRRQRPPRQCRRSARQHHEHVTVRVALARVP